MPKQRFLHVRPGCPQRGDGNFYGANANFGGNQLGTLFRMTPSGTLTVIHSFSPGSARYGTVYRVKLDDD